MNIAIIVAAAENNAIGIDNQLPWRLSADLKYFKALTTGHAIVMGRKTFDSIGKALPNRANIVITRSKNFSHDNIIVKHSIDEAIEYCNQFEQVFVIGGDTIYKQMLEVTETIYLTRVHTSISNADAFFPIIDLDIWKLIKSEHHKKDDKNEFDYTFEVYQRRESI